MGDYLVTHSPQEGVDVSAPVTLFVKAFTDEDQAGVVLKALKKLDRQKVFNILNATVRVRDEKGRTKMKESQDIDAKRGVPLGAIAVATSSTRASLTST